MARFGMVLARSFLRNPAWRYQERGFFASAENVSATQADANRNNDCNSKPMNVRLATSFPLHSVEARFAGRFFAPVSATNVVDGGGTNHRTILNHARHALAV